MQCTGDINHYLKKYRGWTLAFKKKKKAPDPNHSCVSNSGSPFSLITCKAHVHIEIRPQFELGWRNCIGPRPCQQLSHFFFSAIVVDWRIVGNVQTAFTHQYIERCVVPPAAFWALITCHFPSPVGQEEKRKNEPGHLPARPSLHRMTKWLADFVKSLKSLMG